MAGNVVLTGFMGTGKTTVGRALAARLGRRFVDTDVVIEERHGPIPEIFERHGEGYFRRLERDLAAELAARSDLVVSTGGRLMVDPVNATVLSATGSVFCLTAQVETIVGRVGGEAGASSRPLLAGHDVRARIAALLAERAPAYARFDQIPTDDRSPDTIAADLMSRVISRSVPGASRDIGETGTMASFDDGAVTIHYDLAGDGYPILLIAPGGMRSEAQKWSTVPYDPIAELSGTYRTIAMDQRNAGRSQGPIAGDHGWHTYRDDQLALLDHLDVERCHVVGMCIGGPFIVGLLRAAPERFSAAILLQPVGISDNREAFFEIFEGWREEMAGAHPEVTDAEWTSFRDHMWNGDFVLTATPGDVAEIEVPMLVAMGNDLYHPAPISREIAARTGARLVESWKDGDDLAAFRLTAAEFLAEHTP